MHRTVFMQRHLITAALVALAVLSGASVSAQEPGLDEVALKNGGSLRGTVIASEPGTSVRLLEFGQKEPRVVPWSQVSHVERGKYAPKVTPEGAAAGYGAAPLAPAPPVPPPAELKVGAPGVVKLHVESPMPARVVEEAGVSVGRVGGYSAVMHHLETICAGTCDRVIDGSLGQTFVVTGDFPTPRAFRLDGYQGDVSLQVQPGSTGRRLGGVTLAVVGMAGTVAGGILFASGALIGGATGTTSSSLTHGAIGTLAGGTVALAGGIALIVTSGTKIALHRRDEGKAAQSRPRYWLGEF